MRRKVLYLLVFAALLLFFQVAVAQRDDETLVEYPGGDYGISIGGGYEWMPDGKLLASSGYRDDYFDTSSGPVLEDQFVAFPEFYIGEDRRRAESAKKEDYYAYYETEATTVPSQKLEKALEGKFEETPEERLEETLEERFEGKPEELTEEGAEGVSEEKPEEEPEREPEKRKKGFYEFF